MIDAARIRIYRLLRASEPYFKTDMVYLASSGFWLTAGQIVGLAAGFGLSLAFGNLVPKEVFGNYKYVFSLAGLFGTITLTFMGNAVTQAVARGYEGALRHGFRSYLLWSIPSTIITLGGAVYYLVNDNTSIALSLLIVAIVAPFLSAYNLYVSYLQGKKDFKRMTIYGFVTTIIPPLLLVGIMLSDVQSFAPAYIAAYYLSMLLLTALFHYRSVRIYKPSESQDPEMTNNAVHLSLINVLGRVASYVDKVLVFHYLGAAPLAIYAFAAAPPQYALKINGVFRTLALPKLAERDIPTLKKTLPRKIVLHFAVAAVVTVLYILLVPYFFRYLFPLYVESIPYSQALGLIILSAPGIWLNQTLIAHMRKRELYIQNTIIPITKMGLFLTLIPLYGIWGVVSATLISGVIGFTISFTIFKRLR